MHLGVSVARFELTLVDRLRKGLCKGKIQHVMTAGEVQKIIVEALFDQNTLNTSAHSANWKPRYAWTEQKLIMQLHTASHIENPKRVVRIDTNKVEGLVSRNLI